MGKSNYPNKLDTSLEIPAVRDNIVEVGSDVLNSLRSAIFNIERTLGVNPQGATGNTVASRVNRSLDGNGNILKEALDNAGLLSGPITDADVSKAAGINESKLNLKYPTTLLQDEISQLIKQVENILATLEELSYLYAAHTHPEAKNRHKGQAIAIDAIERVESGTGMVSSERQTAQELFEALFSSHINYDGSDISKSNRSHEAKQLFFDKTEVSAYVDSEDVQGAIVDVLKQTSGQMESHQDRHHSNGTLRTSIITGAEDDTAGRMVLDEQEISFAKYSSGVSTRLSAIDFLDNPPAPNEPIERSDILRIYSSAGGEASDYQIHSVEHAGSDINIVYIFGMLDRNSESTDRAKIFKNKNAKANPAGLLTTARPYPLIGKVDLIQIADPNASTIISRGIRTSEISINNRYINVTVDGGAEIRVDTWDGAAAAGQTVDTIVKALNNKFVEEAASVLAYRVDYDDTHSPEVALVHSVPSSSAQPFTLSVSRYQTDGGIDSLGFGYVEDEVIDQGSGSEYYIQGEAHSGLDIKLEQTGLTLLAGTAHVTSHVVGIDFEDYGVADGDLLVITNTPSDNGTYVITSVSPDSLAVDAGQLTGSVWDGESVEDSNFYILKNTISLREFVFYKPYGSPAACAVVDIFLNKDREIFYNVRLEYGTVTLGPSDSLVSPCDFNGDISLYTVASPGILSASLTADGVPKLSLDDGTPVELPGVTSSYIRLKSGLYNITLLVFIENSALIETKITNEGDFELLLHGESDINLEENLFIARTIFDSKHSKIVGAGADLPRIFKKLETGITSDKDLSSKALEKVYQGPLRETRSNGVTDGLKLTTATGYGAHESIDDLGNYVVNIAGGACYIRGRRFAFSGYTDLISDVVAAGPHYSGTADKVFIAINEWGEIVFAEAGGGGGGGGACICPFSADSHCILGVIEFDSENPPVAIDLRLFLNDLDLKVLNSITVSPQRGMGHFTEFGEAIKYAKRFGDLFPKAGIPTVHLKSGTHKVVIDTGVTTVDYTGADHRQAASYYGSWINFPVNITGEGHSTVLDIIKIFSNAGEEADDRTDAGNPTHDGFLMIAGPGLQTVPDGNADILDNGFVTLSNLRLKNCSVLIFDPWTKDSDGNKLNWGVKIDRVIFDRSEKADFHHSAVGILFEKVDSDGTETIGNLSISNCQFLNAGALLSNAGPGPAWPASAHRNISFTDNTFRGTGDGALDGGTNYMAWNTGAGNIFDFQDAPSVNNIEYRGNINADSEASAGAHVDPSNVHTWGDRISRDLNVGGQVGIGKNVAIHPITLDNCRLQVSGGVYDYAIGTQDGGIWVEDGGIWVRGGNIVLQDGNIEVKDGQVYLAHNEVSVGGSLGYDTGSLIIGDLTAYNLAFDETGIHGRNNGANNYLLLNKHGAPVCVGYDSTYTDLSLTGHEFQVNGDSEFIGAVDIRFGDLSMTGGSLNVDGNNVNLTSSNLNCWGGSSKVRISDSFDLPDDDYALINIHAVLLPAIMIEGANSANGEIAVPGKWTAAAAQTWNQYKPEQADQISLGWWDRNNSGKGPFSGTDYFEVFKFNCEDGRLHIYQNSGSSNGFDDTRHGGLFLHKQGTHDSFADTWRIMFNNQYGNEVDVLSFSHGPFVRGYLRTTTNVGAIDFTGQHRSISEESLEGEDCAGMIVCSNGVYKNTDLGTKVSINEALPTVSLSRTKNDKKVYGVISNYEDSNSNTREYEQGSFVTVIDKEDGDNRLIINSLGEGGIWVCNINGDLENGDYITTCEIPGYGSRQDDDLLHNYTVAKITCDCNFDLNSAVYQCITFEHDGKTYKKAFVGCTYHCG